jgi:chitin synthase
VTDLFDRSAVTYPGCAGLTAAYATTNLCTTSTNATCSLAAPTATLFTSLGLTNTSKQVGYDWDQLGNFTDYLVIDGNVLNFTPYMIANPTPIANDTVDMAIRFMLLEMNGSGGRDATRIFYNRDDLRASVTCLVHRYYAGHIDKVTPGCFVSNLFLYVSLGLIMTIVMARFFMACLFSWYLSAKLIKEPKNLKRHAVSPAVMPEGANIDVDNTTGAAPWTNQEVQRKATMRLRKGETRSGGRGGGAGAAEKDYLEKPTGAGAPTGGAGGPDAVGLDGMISMASIGAELFCVCLVTCYSEGADGIKTTLDSIAGTTYSDARKLIFIVCDGMITGHGEKASTPDICVAMLEADPRFGEPQAMSYVAIGDGSKAHNQAMVYAGHYSAFSSHALLPPSPSLTLTRLLSLSQPASQDIEHQLLSSSSADRQKRPRTTSRATEASATRR